MAVNIVTGMTGRAHITSDDDRMRNAANFGRDKLVFNFGRKFETEKLSNNEIRIKDGMLLNQGTQMGIEPNDYEDVIVENGVSGSYRNDLIVMRYQKNPDTAIESASLVVIKGTTVSSNPQDPTYESGNILDGGDLIDDFPLFRVKIESLSITEIEPLFELFETSFTILENKMSNLQDAVDDVEHDVSDLSTQVNTNTDDISGLNTRVTRVEDEIIDVTTGIVTYSHLSKTSQHNLIELTNESGTYTYSGVQYIVNREAGTVFVPEGQTITDTVWINIASNYIENPGGRLTLSGCPDGGSNNTYALSANLGGYIDTGSGESGTSAIFSVDLRIRSGTTIPEGGLLFRPMVRYSEDTDNSFYRGSKSNIQLSKELDILKDNTGKNKLTGTVTAFNNYGTVSYSDTDGWGYTNTTTSSEERLIFIIQYFNSGTYVKSVGQKTIYQRFGLVEGEFEKDSSYDTIYFGHQGTTNNKVIIDVSDLPDGKYVLSINLLSNSPKSAGGLSWNQMMIRPVGSPRGFELPCMTNKELTEALDDVVEEGTWTPNFYVASAPALTINNAKYTKAGHVVTINALATFNNPSYIMSDLSIDSEDFNFRGLPFTVDEFQPTTLEIGFYGTISGRSCILGKISGAFGTGVSRGEFVSGQILSQKTGTDNVHPTSIYITGTYRTNG